MKLPTRHSPTVALVYDHVTTRYGGAEVVLEQLHQLYPKAPLFTTVADTNVATWAHGWHLHTSFLQKLPRFLRRRHQWQALLAPVATESLEVSQYDIVISVSAGSAKCIITHPRQLHVCYVLTPTRYLYDDQLFTAHRSLRLPGIHWLAEQARSYLRWWDLVAANRPDHLIAISKLVASRTKKYYQLTTSEVIYPPFRQRSAAESLVNTIGVNQKFDLIISRLVWYKGIETAIAAAAKTNRLLLIVGSGPSSEKLQKIAENKCKVKTLDESLAAFLIRAHEQQATILFCGALNDGDTHQLLQSCRSLLMLGIEDFGMTALEALAVGKPVIINSVSGVAELLTNRTHGLLLPTISVETVTRALLELDTISFSPALLKQTALRYSDSVFRHKFAAAISRMWQQKEDYDRNA